MKLEPNNHLWIQHFLILKLLLSVAIECELGFYCCNYSKILLTYFFR